MTILRLDNVSLAYGHHPLLARVSFQIAPGERVCLVGRNGTGKSTLLRVICGIVEPDKGEIWRHETLRIGYLEQEVPADTDQTVFEAVASGLGPLGASLAAYHNATFHADAAKPSSLRRLAELQAEIDVVDGWNINRKVATVLTRLRLPPDQRLAHCSGGTRRQSMLARALVSEPDLLLLDEPTNHLDIGAITWLERFLLGYRGALIFITHDRTLMKHWATRIIELDRGELKSFPGDFDSYLLKKEELLEIEAREAAKFDKKLTEEEAWIRRGIKARRTRNEGRVRALETMRRERGLRQAAPGKAAFGIGAGSLSGRLVIDMRGVGFRYGDMPLIRDLSTAILRGDRVGIIGPNGCGKSTLLKLILGEISPTEGQVVLGTGLEVAYYDQQRGSLDPQKTVRENICEGTDTVEVQGRRRHVIGYLKDFLFPPERMNSPVAALSGGERNRLLLAKIFTQAANMLVLDEPTNDLDVDTLELLEDLLADYQGTLLLVSHDRTFLDNVVTSTLVFEGGGRVGEYVGGYEDWVRYRERTGASTFSPQNPVPPAKNVPVTAAQRSPGAGKLSYKERRELNTLPGEIDTLEAEQARLTEAMGDAKFYRQPGDQIAAAVARLEEVRKELEARYARWEHLEARGKPE